MKNRTITVKEISKELCVSNLWVRHLARTGKIPATKKGKTWYFNIDEVLKAYSEDNGYGK